MSDPNMELDKAREALDESFRLFGKRFRWVRVGYLVIGVLWLVLALVLWFGR